MAHGRGLTFFTVLVAMAKLLARTLFALIRGRAEIIADRTVNTISRRAPFRIASRVMEPPSPPILLQYRVTHVTLISSSISEALLWDTPRLQAAM